MGGEISGNQIVRQGKFRPVPKKFLVTKNGKFIYDPVLWYEYPIVQVIPVEEIIETPEEPLEFLDSTDIEFIVYQLSALEIELLILKYLGYTSKEITEIMNFKNIYWYYRLNNRLRKNATKLINYF
jgi:hypothetical protein